MNLEGRLIRLRAVEPDDVELMYAWENDSSVWPVSGTTEPFSHHQMAAFVERQREGDIFRTGQLRLIIETRPDTPAPSDEVPPAPGEQHPAKHAAARPAATPAAAVTPTATTEDATTAFAPQATPAAKPRPVGAVDLFEFDPLHGRAGIGILIHAEEDRGRGYAADAVQVLCRYARQTLRLHQLWCNVGAANTASLRLFRAAGFRQIGVKHDWQWTPDGYRDEVMMQKLL